MAARLWCIVALIAVTLCALQPFLVIRAYRERERVIVLDPSGTFHVSPLLGFEEASKLHEQHALLACLALFQRNPAGFDFPELDAKAADLHHLVGAPHELQAAVGEAAHVVFVTAYDRYAVEAFERGAVDYILKPATAERLAETRESRG